MPVTLPTPFAPSWAGRPPGLASRDYGIWSRFRDKPPFQALAYYFNVTCGTPAEPGDSQGHFTPEAWAFVTSLRIDVVAELADRWLLIEVRRGASLPAVGTIDGYLMCWRQHPPDQRPAEGLIVTDRAHPDAITLAKNHGISVYEVGP